MERVRRPRRAHRRVPESLRRGEKLDVPHRVQRAALPGSGAFYLTLVPIRRRSRGERRSLRTFPGVSLRPPLAFNPRHRRLSTPLLTPMNSTPTFARMDPRPPAAAARRLTVRLLAAAAAAGRAREGPKEVSPSGRRARRAAAAAAAATSATAAATARRRSRDPSRPPSRTST